MASDPSFFVRVSRIEVQTSSSIDESEKIFVWSVTARLGLNDSIFLMAYLRAAAEDGFGQVQVAGFTQDFSWSEVTGSAESTASYLDWSASYASEIMYDTARRALQAQAAAMDFQFDIDVSAPDEPVELRPPTDEQLERIRAAEASQED
ncbi:hypothetical protein SAMN06295974_0371 [Plantibacter flavus]|uniref:Uncharacterized protein n=1 Tax=Plantibacter flavus TaxID=150123 RepID=A0A3N2C0W4_9MICO|nr:hypothetical protein [Plantibacter flavus]ROR81146.1 hypothetical protein EDD42_1198 [Plantibacter flavus]SMG08323.1 hypothetical protein SAMN06295974_0371 [Plantibacter flavus]